MLIKLYRIFVTLAMPFILILLFVRRRRGKEDPVRWRERFGKKLPARPKGRLIWMHGASVGECLSMQPLINRLLEKNPNLHIMVTSGTVTSAELMKKRLPKRAFHVYVPVDLCGSVRRFVRHFKPDAVLWFESEFWPNALNEIHRAQIPLVLLNGRISDRSFRRWQRFLCMIKPILGSFTFVFGQTEEDARRLRVLGAPDAVCVGNIKCAAPPAPFNQADLDDLLAAIGDRLCWVGGSTHPDEESQMADIHKELLAEFPNLLTISAPRHPERREEIKAAFEKRGLTVAVRSKGEQITDEVQVYLADTLGEMGLIYRLAPIVFVGGSLIPFGGQNMLEPMRLKRVVIIGPHAFNFRAIVASGKEKGALIEVADKNVLKENLSFYLSHPQEAEMLAGKAEKLACSEMAVLDRVYDVLEKRGIV
ncbi:MAG: 3-deoxy-D-manno-octulosonic acid transferase [Alphaproteobacteria bacterium]|nr:3-deoxy-D-manno-octulosonic acid transferase [Alphaproteobacteria bacterium]